MKALRTAVLVMLMHTTYADTLFKEADLNLGEQLVEKNCISCHASSFGGDGSTIYTREDRKIKTQSALLTQVRNCSTMLDLKWFEEDEINAAAYLNKHYYHY